MKEASPLRMWSNSTDDLGLWGPRILFFYVHMLMEQDFSFGVVDVGFVFSLKSSVFFYMLELE